MKTNCADTEREKIALRGVARSKMAKKSGQEKRNQFERKGILKCESYVTGTRYVCSCWQLAAVRYVRE